MPKDKPDWGGKGRGGGRKPKITTEPIVRVTVRLPQSQYDWLNRQGNISETLRKLIQETMNHESKNLHD